MNCQQTKDASCGVSVRDRLNIWHTGIFPVGRRAIWVNTICLFIYLLVWQAHKTHWLVAPLTLGWPKHIFKQPPFALAPVACIAHSSKNCIIKSAQEFISWPLVHETHWSTALFLTDTGLAQSRFWLCAGVQCHFVRRYRETVGGKKRNGLFKQMLPKVPKLLICLSQQGLYQLPWLMIVVAAAALALALTANRIMWNLL